MREEKRKKKTEEGFIMLMASIDYRGHETPHLLLAGWGTRKASPSRKAWVAEAQMRKWTAQLPLREHCPPTLMGDFFMHSVHWLK